MKTLTLSQLRDKLLTLRGAVPITISALTQVKTPIEMPPVLKLARVNGISGADYAASLSRATGETHTSRSRTWGTRVTPHVVVHGDKTYLTLKVEHAYEHVYLSRHGSLLKTVKDAEVLPYLTSKASAIKVRDYDISHIKRIAFGGERYKIVEDRA